MKKRQTGQEHSEKDSYLCKKNNWRERKRIVRKWRKTDRKFPMVCCLVSMHWNLHDKMLSTGLYFVNKIK